MEILFKAKRADGKGWQSGKNITRLIHENVERIFIANSFWFNESDLIHAIEWIEVIPETVCQFTGLTDKNGNKIFSGDKLESKEHGNAFVVYDPSMGMYGMKSQGSEAIDFDLWLYCKHAEITGNIHDDGK
jgi:uncharacterized phage protein (TIGR01671 family)